MKIYPFLGVLLLTAAPVLAQTPSDRAQQTAAARSFMARLDAEVAALEQFASEAKETITQCNKRIAKLEQRKSMNPKFSMFYDEQLMNEKANRDAARGEVNEANAQLAQLKQTKEEWQRVAQTTLDSPKAPRGREKQLPK